VAWIGGMGRLFSKRGQDGGRCSCNSPDEVDVVVVVVVFPHEHGVSVTLVRWMRSIDCFWRVKGDTSDTDRGHRLQGGRRHTLGV